MSERDVRRGVRGLQFGAQAQQNYGAYAVVCGSVVGAVVGANVGAE